MLKYALQVGKSSDSGEILLVYQHGKQTYRIVIFF